MTQVEAERRYTDYLDGHTGNVAEALELLNTLDIQYIKNNYDKLKEICSVHDKSKYEEPEFTPYRKHYYPINDEEELETEAYDVANQHHVKNNKHHWMYWVNDETGELEIPDKEDYMLYTVERVCDWIAVSYQHKQHPKDWYDINKTDIIMPDYGFDLCDEIMNKIPKDISLSFRGTRGKLDESVLNEESVDDLKKEIIKLKGKDYLDGIINKSKGHAGYYVLKKVVDSLKSNQAENKLKQGDNGISDEEYIQIMKDIENEKKIKHVHYDKSYDYDESNEAKDKIRKELGENYKVEKSDKGYLVEANLQQLRRTTLTQDPTRAKKSKNVQSKYIGISKYGVLNFKTSSETHSGVDWYQEVHFPNLSRFMNIVEQGDVIEQQDVEKVLKSDNVKISCFTEDIEVKTLDGIKKIKDIKVGDKVITHTGKYQEVLQTFENDYNGELIEINGVKSTPNHPYLVKLPTGEIQWMMACEITKDMKLLEIK